MKQGRLIFLFLLALSTQALGGTYTIYSTRIPVPVTADGTTNGDTSASSTNSIHLDANVYVPDGVVAPAPAVVVVHGFGETKSTATIVTLAEDFAAAGYVVVTPTVRGFGNSDGLVSLVGPNEVNDLKTIILAMQTGSIGDAPAIVIPVTSASKFGVMGPSYGGGHTFEIMRTHVAGLTAVIPIIGWTDLYQALAPNDVPKLTYTLGLFATGFDFENPNYAPVMFDWLRDILNGTPEATRQGGPESNIDWRSVIFNPAELTVPAFVIQGWQDDLFPAEQALQLVQTNQSIPFLKLYIGGLGHPPASLSITGNEGVYLRGQAVRWFDQWLKGIDTGITNEPLVTLAPENTTNWSGNALIQVSSLPLSGTVTNTYFLNGSTLSTVSPAPNGKVKKLPPSTGFLFVLRPLLRAVGADDNTLMESILSVNAILNSDAGSILNSKIFTKPDGGANRARFTSATLPADLNVVGSPSCHLIVSAGKSNAYYYVQILEHPAKGKTQLITRGAFKDHTANPATPHAIDFSPFTVNHTFRAGSQIFFQITSRDYPFFLPNLSQPTVKIYRDAVNTSTVSLPVAP
ncbi:MAG: CocE/NonD family hydrolase [Verrucomicrobiia bacterium]|jgi:predicted acyl esterase